MSEEGEGAVVFMSNPSVGNARQRHSCLVAASAREWRSHNGTQPTRWRSQRPDKGIHGRWHEGLDREWFAGSSPANVVTHPPREMGTKGCKTGLSSNYFLHDGRP